MKTQEKFRNKEMENKRCAMPAVMYVPDSALISDDIIKENKHPIYDDQLSPGFIY